MRRSSRAGSICGVDPVPRSLPTAPDGPPRTLCTGDLAALGIGAAIGGNFFGWQATLAHGFTSGLVALGLAALLYLLLSASVAEVTAVASTFGTQAGPCQFAETCFGERVAFLTGLAEVLKCVVCVSISTLGFVCYVTEIGELAPSLAPFLWLACLAGSVVLHCQGSSMSKNTTLAITICSVLILVVFYAGGFATLQRGPDAGRPEGAHGRAPGAPSAQDVFAVFPFALWFFLGIEEIPVAMEVAIDPNRSIPRALCISFFVTMVLGFATMIISFYLQPGIAQSTYPLLEGYVAIFGASGSGWWAWLLIVGLFPSLHSFVFATGELVAQLAEEGYFPGWFRHRSGLCEKPVRGLIMCAGSSFAVLIVLYLATGDVDKIGNIAVALAMFCTLISYMVQLACFLVFRWDAPQDDLTCQSPFGVTGAVVCLGLCAAALGAVLYLPVVNGRDYLHGLGLAVATLALGSAAREASRFQFAKPVLITVAPPEATLRAKLLAEDRKYSTASSFSRDDQTNEQDGECKRRRSLPREADV